MDAAGMAAYAANAAVSASTPVASPLASRSMTPPTGSGLSRSMPTARNPALLSTQKCPEMFIRQTGWSGETGSRSAAVGCRSSASRVSS